ncbi:helix-turn-helix transcriptional regulator [uncultured Ferrimonas sp.]|uniref:helix-turn-helix transcriptional regulator n=1 Tax=uncultured Ferrimonas sp. TaxID=432640 RepID=UPI00263366C2|nr:helix-turn-helix transcriptional regulator [uncultured Ferrimonas sp.]
MIRSEVSPAVKAPPWRQYLLQLCDEFGADSGTLFLADPLGHPQQLLASHRSDVVLPPQATVEQLTLTSSANGPHERVQLLLQRQQAQFSSQESGLIASRLQRWQRQWQQRQLLQQIENQVYQMMWAPRWRQPLLVLDCDGKVLHSNGAFERLCEREWLSLFQRQLQLRDKLQQQQLQESIEQLRSCKDGQARQLLLGPKADCWRLDLHGMVDGAAQILLQFTSITFGENGGALLSVIRLFGLSPQEGRVAMRIAQGVPAKVIAAGFDVEESTIRTHIRHILSKTQCRNQMELVGRLNRILL